MGKHGQRYKLNDLPSACEDHRAYAIPSQGHSKAPTDHWVEIEKTRVKINWAESTRCYDNRLESFKNRLYGKRSIMTA